MPKTQAQKFKETARAILANDDETAFNAALKRIGLAKAVAGKPKAKPSKKSR